MSSLIRADNISLAWMLSLEHLLEIGGSEPNLITAITSNSEDIAGIRKLIDEFLGRRRGRWKETVSKVADTIFPSSLYHLELGAGALDNLFENQSRVRKFEQRTNRRLNYFARLTGWPGGDGPTNQLAEKIRQLKAVLASGIRTFNQYELAVETSEDAIDASRIEGTVGLNIYDPDRDGRVRMGFPCLSHISLTLFRGRLDLTAIYRNQHFIRKAYGNFIGLQALLRFICREVGCEVGELVCVATHADLEIGDFARRDIATLIENCRRVTEVKTSQCVTTAL